MMMRHAILAAAVAALLTSPARAGDPNDLGGTDLGGLFGKQDVVVFASRNQAEGVQAALMKGNSPDVTDELGISALIYAAKFNNVEMARVLIDRNASMLVHDKVGNVPMHWAAAQGDIEIIRMLIAAHSPVDPTNREGVTPLMLAASKGQTAAVRLLLQNGADATKQDFTGRDALGWANQASVRSLLSQKTQ